MGGNHSTMTGDSTSSSARKRKKPDSFGSSASSSSASVQLFKDVPSKKDDKDTKSIAVIVPRKSPAGQARPCHQNGNRLLPAELEHLIHSYHADHFDVEGYTIDQCRSFTLFNRNAVPAWYAFGIGRLAEGSPVDLAAAAGNLMPSKNINITKLMPAPNNPLTQRLT